jgi:hypothetical protein
MTDTPETNTSSDRPHHFLAGLAQQGDYAYGFAKAGRQKEALEHAEAIERLIAAYREAVHAEEPGLVGNELVVQWWLNEEGRWRDWGGSIPGLFLEDAKRQLKQARTGFPDGKFRLMRRKTLFRVEEIADEQSVGGGA